MKSSDILAAIRSAYPRQAVVHEVVIHDHLWDERAAVSKPIRRIDALMFDSLQRTAIEIKVSKADLKRDTWQKRAPWAAVTHRFVYVMPIELFESIDNWGALHSETGFDIYGCGVWTVDDAGRVKVARKAVINRHPEPLPQQVIQSLAYRAAGVSEQLAAAPPEPVEIQVELPNLTDAGHVRLESGLPKLLHGDTQLRSDLTGLPGESGIHLEPDHMLGHDPQPTHGGNR